MEALVLQTHDVKRDVDSKGDSGSDQSSREPLRGPIYNSRVQTFVRWDRYQRNPLESVSIVGGGRHQPLSPDTSVSSWIRRTCARGRRGTTVTPLSVTPGDLRSPPSESSRGSRTKDHLGVSLGSDDS